MALVKKYSVSLVFLAVVTLGNAQGHPNAVNPLCKTAKDPAFCTSMVKGAKNPHEAAANAIAASLEVVKRTKPLVDTQAVVSLLPRTLLPASRESMVSTCRDNYQDVIDNLTGALADLKKGDKDSLIIKLSASCLSDCVDGFQQFNIPSPNMKKAQEELNRYTEYSLVVSKLV